MGETPPPKHSKNLCRYDVDVGLTCKVLKRLASANYSPIISIMYFDGNLSVEFTYDGEKIHETVCPIFAVEDKKLKDCWNYVFHNDYETVRFTLVGKYDENDNLSTADALFIKALCFWDGRETIIDDIDIV